MGLSVRSTRLTFSLIQRLKVYATEEAEEASMKDVTTALLASFLVLLSLVSLISADPVPPGTKWASLNNWGSLSELEFRYALRR